MNAPQPLGLVRAMAAADYHADRDSVSNTMLSAMNKSAAHCYALHLDPLRPIREATAAMRGGTMAHTYILEPETFFLRYTVKPEGIDYRTRDGQAWRNSQTMEVVTTEEVCMVDAQRSAIHKVAALRNLLSKGDAEASVFWNDHATGLRCRARPDWLHWTGPKRVVCLDIKTIADITPEAVQRAVATYGYHRQAAHYTAGLIAAGLTVEEFVFGFVSSSYPFIAAAYVLDDETAAQGREEVAELLDRFAYCKSRGEWPAFGDGYQPTGLPAWAKRSSEVEVAYV